MKTYFLGALAIMFALGISAFVTPIKEATCVYVFKYIGPSTYTQSNITNSNNWRVRIGDPYLQCTPESEDAPCTFTTYCEPSYLVIVDADIYKPSTNIVIIAKQSDLPGKYVVDYVESASEYLEVSLSVENFDL